MSDRQAMQMALDAWDSPMGMIDLCVVMDALRARLEQPEQPEQRKRLSDFDARGILAAKLTCWHRLNYFEADELVKLFIDHVAPEQRKPLTQQEVVDGFCKTPHQVQYVAVFDAGVRYAEAAHDIKETP